MANNRFQCRAVLFIFTTAFSLILTCSNNELYIIKPVQNQDLALDGNDSSLITVQEYTGVPSQLWVLEVGDRVGFFYIINNSTGKTLDFFPTNQGLIGSVAKKKRKSLSQQWAFRLDGKITNAENRRNLDVHNERFVPGNPVILLPDNGFHAQDFVVEKFQFSDLLIHES